MRKLITYTNKTILRRAAVIAATLALAMGVNPARASTVSETVTISSGPNLPINSSFIGLSYEKKWMAVTGYFSNTNTPLIKLFNLLGPGVVRIGAGQVDLYNWYGYDNCKPITSNEVASLAAFMTNVPQWKVIYGLNYVSNDQATCSNEAKYAASELGPQLLGFEIGNEPDEYGNNGLEPHGFTTNDYITDYNPLKTGAEGFGPLVGPATADHSAWTEYFTYVEQGIISMATQHYYGGDASIYTNLSGALIYGDTNAILLLITNNPTLPTKCLARTDIVVNRYTGRQRRSNGSCSQGAR